MCLRWFGTVEQPRRHLNDLYTPSHLCYDVVREGSRKFDALELPQPSA